MSIEHLNKDTVAAALMYPGSISLVYASHKRAGGGYKNHEKGQEEFIARRTDLVERLAPFKHLYGDNRKPFYIMLPGVKVNDTDEVRDFIVSHAPVARLYDDPNAELEKRIIEVCRRVAPYDVFITGPWGGGFFGCDRDLALELFEKYATNDKVIFAIPE
jgi:hypothetical protein